MLKQKAPPSFFIRFALFVFYLFFCVLCFQGLFPLRGLKLDFIPYFTLAPLVFFFFYKSAFYSLCLLFLISVFSAAFSSLPVLSLFLIYFLFFALSFLVKNFFFSKPEPGFFILLFLFSFSLPWLLDLAQGFTLRELLLSTEQSYLFKAFSSLVLSFLLFPLFKKTLT